MKNSGIGEIISKRNKADAALDSATLIDKLLSKPKETERFKKIVEANVKSLELALKDNIEFTEEQRQQISDSIKSGNNFIKPIEEIKHIMDTGTYTLTISLSGGFPINSYEMTISRGSLTLDEFRINDRLILTELVLSGKDGFNLIGTINGGESFRTGSIEFEKNTWVTRISINEGTYDFRIEYQPDKNPPIDEDWFLLKSQSK
jgi:hypothetical protein